MFSAEILYKTSLRKRRQTSKLAISYKKEGKGKKVMFREVYLKMIPCEKGQGNIVHTVAQGTQDQ